MGVNTKSSGKSGGPVKGKVPQWAEPIVRISDWIYPWCLWVGGITLFAILTALMFGKTDAGWLSPALGAFAFFTSVGVIAALVACHHTLVPGWVNVVIGAALLFGGNIVISFLAAQGKIPRDNLFLTQVYDYIPNVGMLVLISSVLRLMVGFTLAFIYEQTRADSAKYKYSGAKAVEKPGLIPKCWQMSRCRPGVREQCPNFTDRITCWQRRSGCFCDRNLANFLVSASDRKDFTEADDMARNLASVDKSGKGAIRGHMQSAAKRPWIQQRRLCHECPLYLEHQEYKYRNWHWISFPLTAGIVGLLYPFFHEGYGLMAEYLDLFMKRLVEIGKLPENFDPSASTLKDSPFEYVLLFMVGLVLASYVVSLIDKMFLDWKL